MPPVRVATDGEHDAVGLQRRTVSQGGDQGLALFLDGRDVGVGTQIHALAHDLGRQHVAHILVKAAQDLLAIDLQLPATRASVL